MKIALTIILSLVYLVEPASASVKLDSMIEVQRNRTGNISTTLFEITDDDSSIALQNSKSNEDYRFLLAYLPLADLAGMSSLDLLDNVNLARKALDSFEWGESIPDEVFRHFILPHRISQEPFVNGWRRQFYNELKPLVKDLTMSEAALRVNHWCLEKATFKQTSGRDQDPLTTIRSGFGRCEEEMIFTIAAMRSIGIPARQCYTPYWAHADNNHAWVEVWTDGKWSYLGACEPKQTLSEAWFTRSAGRAMLVVSTAYGEYSGNEPVLKKYGRSTTINSTSVYSDVRDISISVLDKKGNPQPDQRVIFSLFNYGGFMPALALNTDMYGKSTLVSGNGSWIVSSGTGKLMDVVDINNENESLTLNLDKYFSGSVLSNIDYAPPPAPEAPENSPPDSLFKACIKRENEIREARLWNYWTKDAGLIVEPNISLKPSEEDIYQLSNSIEIDSAEVYELLSKCRGNWGNVYKFLTGSYPNTDGSQSDNKQVKYSTQEVINRFQLLRTLTKKDLRDFNTKMLDDHFISISSPDVFNIKKLPTFGFDSYSDGLDEQEKEIYSEYVLKPRIGREPSSTWRVELRDFLKANPKLIDSKRDKKLIKWLKKNIEIEKSRDRLGPGLTPSQTLMMKRGSSRDLERCYIALCRVRGIPAKFNSVNNELERWNGRDWDVIQLDDRKNKNPSGKHGQLYIDRVIFNQDEVQNVNQMPDSPEDWHDPAGNDKEILYFRDWLVQKWDIDHFTAMDFGYKKPFDEIEWPQELSSGLYCVTSGFRQKDGSAKVKLSWFEIKNNKDTHENLVFR